VILIEFHFSCFPVSFLLFLLGFLTHFIVIRLLTFSVTATTYKRHNVSISIEFFSSSLLILSLYFVGYYRNEHDDNI
jgi:hypothetical protein